MVEGQADTSSKKVFTLDECKKHTSEKDCWLIMHGKVYNVTDFLDEHPGGYDIVVSATGKDATEDFEEIGHSSTAKEMLNKFYIGDFSGGSSTFKSKKVVGSSSSTKSSPAAALIKSLVPIIIVLIAIYLALKIKG